MLATAPAGKAVNLALGVPLTYTIYSDVRGKYPAIAAVARTEMICHMSFLFGRHQLRGPGDTEPLLVISKKVKAQLLERAHWALN